MQAPGYVAIAARNVGVKYDLAFTRERTLRKTVANALSPRHRGEREEFWAVRGINLLVRPGEILGVIGRNGSGKSTLMMTLAGIIEPDEGSVRTFEHRPTLLTLGAGFEPELTGRQNVFLNAAYLGLSRRAIEAQVDAIVEFAELGSFADVPLKKYSTGMRARLAFSVAAQIEPEILLLDELLGVGDADFQEKSRSRLAELMGRSKAIVIVTHSMSFVRQTCSNVLWLHEGRIAAYGEPEQVVGAYEQGVGVTTAPTGAQAPRPLLGPPPVAGVRLRRR